MPRIRTIKPEFPEDETLGAVSRDARLLFILIWTRCDDYGRFRASPVLLRASLFPYDEDVTAKQIDAWLGELSETGRVLLYEVDNQSYGWVVRWGEHQRVDNAGKPLCPAPPGPDPPQVAAARRDSPLDHDQDQERTTTGRGGKPPCPLPANLWTTYAARAYAETEKKPTNPSAWKRKVAQNSAGDSELVSRAEKYHAEYELTENQLVDVLRGKTNILKTAPWRIA